MTPYARPTVLALLLAVTPPARAQEAPRPAPAPAPADTVTRVYEIRDLVQSARNYADSNAIVPPTRMGEPRGRQLAELTMQMAQSQQALFGGNGGDQAGRKVRRASPYDDIVHLVTDTIAPESWKDNGGAVGSARVLNGQLVITQLPEHQKEIEALLNDLRAASSRMVTTVARWVMLQPEDLKTVLKTTAGAGSPVQEVDLAALQKLPNDRTQYRGQTTCFNGQTVQIASGRVRTVITDTQPLVSAGASGYQPTVSFVQAGAMLEITPLLLPDGSAAVLDVRSVASEWNRDPVAEVVSSPSSATTQPGRASAGAIDRIDMVVQHFGTTVTVPVGRPALLGGMTFEPGQQGSGSRQLYLIVEIVAAISPK